MIKTILDILVYSVPIVSFLTCIFPMIFDYGKKIVNSMRKIFGSVFEKFVAELLDNNGNQLVGEEEQSTKVIEQNIVGDEKLTSNVTKISSNEIKQNVVEDLLNKKIKRNNFSLILLSVCFLAYWAIGSLSIVDIKNEVAICLSSFILCVLIFNLLIRYRISKSYYGTNYEEAKELIYLFKEDSNKNGKNTGKKFFTDINDQVNAKEIVPVPDSQWQY